MPVTLDQLSAAVNGFFAQKLRGTIGDKAGSIVLVFDGFGSPLSPNEFGAGATTSQQQLLAHQRAAQIADQLPAANGLTNGWYLPRTGGRLSFWYKALLTGSVCTSQTEQAIAEFESRKASALKRLDQNELLEIAGVTGAGGSINPTGVTDTNYATGMSPINWFLPDADSWETHRIDGMQPVPPVPTPIPVPLFIARASVTMPNRPDSQHSSGSSSIDWFRSVGETVSAGEPLARIFFLSLVPGGDIIDIVIPAPATGTLLGKAPGGRFNHEGDQIAVIGLHQEPAVVAERNAVVMPDFATPVFGRQEVGPWHKAVGDHVTFDDLLVDIKTISPITDDESNFPIQSPVSGTMLEINKREGELVDSGTQLAVIGAVPSPPQGFTVEFDYTIVSFSRPWWDEVFLSSANWAVIGFSRGEISSGNLRELAASGITLVTSGMVVIRNLKITSNWRGNERDQLTSGALNLGPFSLTGAEVNGQTLTRPGAQAVGWICQVPPVLPPTSDPALPPA